MIRISVNKPVAKLAVSLDGPSKSNRILGYRFISFVIDKPRLLERRASRVALTLQKMQIRTVGKPL